MLIILKNRGGDDGYSVKEFCFLIIIQCIWMMNATAHSIDEFMTKDSFVKDQTLVLIKYSHQENEIENDHSEPQSQIEFTRQEQLIALEHHFSDNLQARMWLGSAHKFTDTNQKRLLYDPFISFWRRMKIPSYFNDTTIDLGIEFSPQIGNGNIYKNKNGNEILIKYRFGLNHSRGRIHTSYLLGFKDSSSFRQNEFDRKYGSMISWGLRIAGDFKAYEKLTLYSFLSARRKSENQGGVLFPNSANGPSWEVLYGVHFQYKLFANKILSVGYRFQNESSTFNKYSDNLDIEDEQKNYFMSLAYEF